MSLIKYLVAATWTAFLMLLLSAATIAMLFSELNQVAQPPSPGDEDQAIPCRQFASSAARSSASLIGLITVK